MLHAHGHTLGMDIPCQKKPLFVSPKVFHRQILIRNAWETPSDAGWNSGVARRGTRGSLWIRIFWETLQVMAQGSGSGLQGLNPSGWIQQQRDELEVPFPIHAALADVSSRILSHSR